MTSQVVLGYFLSFEIAGEFILRFLWLFLEYLKTKEACPKHNARTPFPYNARAPFPHNARAHFPHNARAHFLHNVRSKNPICGPHSANKSNINLLNHQTHATS